MKDYREYLERVTAKLENHLDKELDKSELDLDRTKRTLDLLQSAWREGSMLEQDRKRYPYVFGSNEEPTEKEDIDPLCIARSMGHIGL